MKDLKVNTSQEHERDHIVCCPADHTFGRCCYHAEGVFIGAAKSEASCGRRRERSPTFQVSTDQD